MNNSSRMTSNIIKMYNLPMSGTFLDLGCGESSWCGLVRSATKGDVTGVDHSYKTISKARNAVPGCNFFCEDIYDYLRHYVFYKYDIISFFDVLQHLEDPHEALELAKDGLTRDGRIIGSVSLAGTGLHTFNSREEVQNILGVSVIARWGRWLFFEWQQLCGEVAVFKEMMQFITGKPVRMVTVKGEIVNLADEFFSKVV